MNCDDTSDSQFKAYSNLEQLNLNFDTQDTQLYTISKLTLDLGSAG